jgi:hypothetical protein
MFIRKIAGDTSQGIALVCRRKGVALSPASITSDSEITSGAYPSRRCALPVAAQLLLAAHERPRKRMILQYAAGAANRKAVPAPFILLGIFGILIGAVGLLPSFYLLSANGSGVVGLGWQSYLWMGRLVIGAVMSGVLILVSRRIFKGIRSARTAAIIYAGADLLLSIGTSVMLIVCRIVVEEYGDGFGRIHFDVSFGHRISGVGGALTLLMLSSFWPGIMLFMMATRGARQFFSVPCDEPGDPTSPTIPTAQAAASPARGRRPAARRAA